MKSGSYLGFDSLFPAVDMSKVIVDYIGIQSDCHYWYSGKTYPNGVPYLIEISYIDGQSVISTDKIIEEEVNTIKSRILMRSARPIKRLLIRTTVIDR